MFSAVNCAPGRGLRCLSTSIASLIVVQVEAGALLDDRQAVVLDVFQVVQDQHAHDVAVRRLRRQLQQQALLQVAGADAGRVELLDHVQRLLDLRRRHRRRS